MQVPTTPKEMSKESIDRIDELARFGNDAVNTIAEAAKRVGAPALKSAFLELAGTVGANTRALEAILEAAGRNADVEDGTIGGSFWTFWTKTRGAINSGDGYVMLTEVTRAAERLETEYREVLIDTAGSPVNAVLQAQHRGVKHRRDDLRSLRDSWS